MAVIGSQVSPFPRDPCKPAWGHRDQVKKWPVNPLNIIIEDLKKYKKGYPSVKEAKKEKAKDGEKEAAVGGETEQVPLAAMFCGPMVLW